MPVDLIIKFRDPVSLKTISGAGHTKHSKVSYSYSPVANHGL